MLLHEAVGIVLCDNANQSNKAKSDKNTHDQEMLLETKPIFSCVLNTVQISHAGISSEVHSFEWSTRHGESQTDLTTAKPFLLYNNTSSETSCNRLAVSRISSISTSCNLTTNVTNFHFRSNSVQWSLITSLLNLYNSSSVMLTRTGPTKTFLFPGCKLWCLAYTSPQNAKSTNFLALPQIIFINQNHHWSTLKIRRQIVPVVAEL